MTIPAPQDSRSSSNPVPRVAPDPQDGTEALSATKGPDMTDHDTEVQTTTDEATVELVARALWSVQARGLLTSWDAQDDEHQEFTREQARAAISAIARPEMARKDAEIERLRRALVGHLFDGESLFTRDAIRIEMIELLTADVARLRDELEELEDWCMERAKELSSFGRSNGATNALWDVIEEIRRRKDAASEPKRPTLAETRTGTDWCPKCLEEVGTDRYTQESSTVERCSVCSAVLVPRPAASEEQQ